MKILHSSFKALKLIITGKSKGGKARTSQLKLARNKFSLQSLKDDLHHNQLNFRTTFGEFGITLISSRINKNIKLQVNDN